MQYSPFLAAAVLRNIVVPLVVTWLATRLLHIHLAWRFRLPVNVAALVVNFWILSYVSLVRQNWFARRLHPQAVPIPRVKGRWPLNLDVMVDWMKSSKGEYLGEGMIAKLEERYGKTMNTRVLGEDSVCTILFSHPIWHVPIHGITIRQIITTSAIHVFHILGPAFTAFDKGPKWKERVHEMIGDGVFGSDGDLWKFVCALQALVKPPD